MTDWIEDAEVINEAPKETNEEPRPDAETAFIIVKDWDGGWRVITDLSIAFSVGRDANRGDVKYGLGELSRFIEKDELVNMLLTKLSEGNKAESQVTSEAMRQALQDRNLM
jgi:hypothetical protein